MKYVDIYVTISCIVSRVCCVFLDMCRSMFQFVVYFTTLLQFFKACFLYFTIFIVALRCVYIVL
jgi:hypothetical protein